MTKEIGVDMGERFSRFVNSATSVDIDGFAEIITTDHRALQQYAFNTFIACMKIWAKNYEKGNYDARNQFTCKMSHEFIEKYYG